MGLGRKTISTLLLIIGVIVVMAGFRAIYGKQMSADAIELASDQAATTCVTMNLTSKVVAKFQVAGEGSVIGFAYPQSAQPSAEFRDLDQIKRIALPGTLQVGIVEGEVTVGAPSGEAICIAIVSSDTNATPLRVHREIRTYPRIM